MNGRRIELSTIQVVSSVLAAVSGAILASSLGVAGTIIGVAVVSFASTAGTAIYRYSLARTQERIRSAAAARGHLGLAAPHNRNGRSTAHGASQDAGLSAAHAHLTGLREADRAGERETAGKAGEHESAAVAGSAGARGAPGGQTPQALPEPDRPPGPAGRGGLAAALARLWTARWLRFAGIAVLVFLLAMGGVTAFEAATGKPLDALIWGAHSSGTTVGDVVSGHASRPEHAPARPNGTPAPHPTGVHHTATPSPSATPTPSPTTSTATPTPSAPASPSPSGAPTAPASHAP